ncbi:MAG: hypothetical protein IH872_02135 [Chloroflexi bacterium]|nr:hypothetical protein [Chloroflexota bacterium]
MSRLSEPWFCFLNHPRDVDDLRRSGSFDFLRRHSSSEAEALRKACTLQPQMVGEVLFGYAPIWGEIISAMLMPEEMQGAQGKGATAKAVSLAASRGAQVVGLGALTSSVTGGGLTLRRNLAPQVTLTNGSAYTASVVRQNVSEATKFIGLGDKARVGLVGCTGSVGVPACHLLADAGFNLVLVGRSVERVRHLFGGLAPQATFAENLSAVNECDIVVLLTSAPSARMSPEILRPGTVVIDFAQPPNIARSSHVRFQQRGVSVVAGGIVQIPSYNCTYDLGLPASDTFACLAETYLFAREGIREHSVGRPSIEFVKAIEKISLKHAVSPRPLEILAHDRD